MLRLPAAAAPLAELSRECASVSTALCDVAVFDCDWLHAMDGSARLRNHVAFLSLTPPPAGIRVAAERLGDQFDDVGDMGIFPAGQRLRAQLPGGAQRLLLCRFSPERFDEVLERPMRWDRAAQRLALGLQAPELRQLLVRMAREVLAPGMASRALLEALGQAAVVEIARGLDAGGGRAIDGAGRLAPWQWRRLQDRLRDDRAAAPSLAEAAALCGTSPRQLMRLFKATTGQALHQWIAERQMVRARELLACTDRPLKAIAADLGFRHAGNFTAAFRRSCGETPSAYRTRAWRPSR